MEKLSVYVLKALLLYLLNACRKEPTYGFDYKSSQMIGKIADSDK